MTMESQSRATASPTWWGGGGASIQRGQEGEGRNQHKQIYDVVEEQKPVSIFVPGHTSSRATWSTLDEATSAKRESTQSPTREKRFN